MDNLTPEQSNMLNLQLGFASEYSDDEPRDEKGRWTSDGGDEASDKVKSIDKSIIAVNQAITDHLQRNPNDNKTYDALMAQREDLIKQSVTQSFQDHLDKGGKADDEKGQAYQSRLKALDKAIDERKQAAADEKKAGDKAEADHFLKKMDLQRNVAAAQKIEDKELNNKVLGIPGSHARWQTAQLDTLKAKNALSDHMDKNPRTYKAPPESTGPKPFTPDPEDYETKVTKALGTVGLGHKTPYAVGTKIYVDTQHKTEAREKAEALKKELPGMVITTHPGVGARWKIGIRDPKVK